MRARAPGKLLLSGAYSVLYGAPALVTAVNRYAEADSSRLAPWVTPEVHAALGDGAPWFSAQALRSGDHKLGLGSSAAILVAALAASELGRRGHLADDELARSVFPQALLAHEQAQEGGSGVDVAASVWGGTLCYVRSASGPRWTAVDLPRDLVITAWASRTPASTPRMLSRVRELEQCRPALHSTLIAAQAAAAEDARSALVARDSSGFLSALAAQRTCLQHLGAAIDEAIVTEEVQLLTALAKQEEAQVLPSGSGAGDLVLFVGREAPSPALLERVLQLGHEPLALSLGSRGVHAVGSGEAREP